MTAAGLPWRADVHDRLLTEAAGLAHRPAAGAGHGRACRRGPPGWPSWPARISAVAAMHRLAGEPGLARRSWSAPWRPMGCRSSSTRLAVLREIDHPAIPLLLEYKELSRLHAAFGWSLAGHLGVGRPVPAGVRGRRGGLGPLGDHGAAARCRSRSCCAGR